MFDEDKVCFYSVDPKRVDAILTLTKSPGAGCCSMASRQTGIRSLFSGHFVGGVQGSKRYIYRD